MRRRTRSRAARRVASRFSALLLGLLLVGMARSASAAPSVSIGSTRFGNVFTAGESPVMAVTVTAPAGEAVRGTLRVGARDAYLASAGQAAVAIELPPGGTQAEPFTLPGDRLGHFTITAKLDGADGRVIARQTATAGIVPRIDASDAEASAVGYVIMPDRSELPRADDIAAEMRLLGIRWVRMQFNWHDDARRERPDTSDPAWLDSQRFERWVDAFRANGIEVLATLVGTARWASSLPEAEGVDPASGFPLWAAVAPHDLEDWERFVRTLAERLRGRVRGWEVWNEPDVVYFWRSSADEFVALTHVTAAVLREVDPDSRVVVNFVDQRKPDAEAFHERVLAGAASVLDVFGWHYGDRQAIAVARQLEPRLRPGATLWNTEAYGVPRRLISRWLEQRAAGVTRLFPFVYHLIYEDSALGLIRFGLYPVNVDYTPRPDAVALRTLSDLVGSATPIESAQAGLGFSTYTFDTPGGAVTALVDGNDAGLTWQPKQALALRTRIPRGVARVEIIDLMGNRTTHRVRNGRLRLRLLGVATFLRAEPPSALSGLRVVASRRARR
jgi:Cellulase (glycosyl hydrolase family 5)